MANPFLFMEDESSAVSAANDAFANPFLVEDDDEEAVDFGADNPFSTSNPFAFNETADENHVETTSASDIFPSDTTTQAGANLFLVEDDTEEPEVDATMSFFGTTINEHDGLQYHKPSDLNVSNHHGLIDDSVNAYSSEEELKGRKPPRPNPPSQVTQQLITNLTDHLDQTSTNLLGKLPVTRTPSPVSMRDLHSPSPTPEVCDLFDVTESNMNHHEEINSFSAQPVIPEPEQKPMRPPPPRPVPPRPTPPSVKSSPVTAPTPIQGTISATVTTAQQPQHEDDLFNFFGTGQQKKPPPKPPAPKTKEDILSLFSAPTQAVAQAQKPDLLSEDIDFSNHVQEQTVSTAPVAVVQPYEPKQESPKESPRASIIPQAIVEPLVQQPVENHEVPQSQSIPTFVMDLTPDLPDDDVDDHPTVIEENNVSKSEVSSDYSPESGITSGGIIGSASGSDLNMTVHEVEQVQEAPVIVQEPFEDASEEVNPFTCQEVNPIQTVLTPPEQLQKLQFLQQKSAEYQYQRPTTPDPIVAQPELAPIFGGPLVPTSPAKPAPPPPPTRGSSILTTPSQPTRVPEIFKSDEFDDFSAKFESKSQPKVTTGNAFLDSLEPAEAAPADAWGASNAFGGASVVVDDGFGNEEDGFDTWDPPVVPESTPYMNRRMSGASDDGKDFSVVIKPRGDPADYATAAPILGPPPPQRSPYSGSVYSEGELQGDIFTDVY